MSFDYKFIIIENFAEGTTDLMSCFDLVKDGASLAGLVMEHAFFSCFSDQ